MERPTDSELAEMLRSGASGIGSSHSEYCISSDNCSCYADMEKMLAAANLLDGGTPEEKQRREDEAIANSVQGFPIFENKEQADRYFGALERLSE